MVGSNLSIQERKVAVLTDTKLH